jgi:hypothetical protein
LGRISFSKQCHWLFFPLSVDFEVRGGLGLRFGFRPVQL